MRASMNACANGGSSHRTWNVRLNASDSNRMSWKASRSASRLNTCSSSTTRCAHAASIGVTAHVKR